VGSKGDTGPKGDKGDGLHGVITNTINGVC